MRFFHFKKKRIDPMERVKECPYQHISVLKLVARAMPEGKRYEGIVKILGVNGYGKEEVWIQNKNDVGN